MAITRRAATGVICVASASPSLHSAASSGWTSEWDRALIAAAVKRSDPAFDSSESMLQSRAGSEYRYHTNLRSTAVHPTRDSLGYALFLLEAGQVEKACKIIDRVVALQDTDPQSKWYGIWGYYLEEPPPKMSPADWNWADFNGSYLLLIEMRHGEKLGGPLRGRVREGIRHAAASVRRRNVSMSYTNIAVQGTFVTLAAAELLRDDDLRGYAADRLRRFARTVDETGSFAEYNSPTYANVTIANLTRMLMSVRDDSSLQLARKLNHRAWLHIARHWHAPTRQLAGPMSRAYSTDIGAPLWIQKALDNRILWAPLGELNSGLRGFDGEVALLNYQLPDELVPAFLELRQPKQHRETFLPGSGGIRPVQGTTWLTPEFALGSVNRGDFWVQRRPVLAYWGHPARWAQLRFVKDDYDLASALIYTVQERGYLLGIVNFRAPGGDKHPSLDPLPGDFAAKRLRLVLEFSPGADVPAPFGASRKSARRYSWQLTKELALAFQVQEARFNDYEGRITAGTDGISVDLLPPGVERVRWADVRQAYVVFALAMGSGPTFNETLDSATYDPETMTWSTPVGKLQLAASKRVAAAAEQDRAFSEFLDGKPVPLLRLSDEKLF